MVYRIFATIVIVVLFGGIGTLFFLADTVLENASGKPSLFSNELCFFSIVQQPCMWFLICILGAIWLIPMRHFFGDFFSNFFIVGAYDDEHWDD